MTTFIIRRVVWTIPVILLVILMTFLMMRQIKGNPFRHTERNVPEAIQKNLERKFHLDRPWYVQYAYYVEGVFTFDLGPSMAQRTRTVNDVVRDGFPRSLKLGLLAYLWAIFLGVPAGILAALRPNSIFDYFAMLFSSIGFALPSFFVATLLIYYVAVRAGLVPTNGWPTSCSSTPSGRPSSRRRGGSSISTASGRPLAPSSPRPSPPTPGGAGCTRCPGSWTSACSTGGPT